MSIVVYWVEEMPSEFPTRMAGVRGTGFDDSNLSEAMKFAEQQRKNPLCSHVIISTELADSIGKAGVDTVQNGKTPDGEDYTWHKQDRAGKERRK
jgi:hypothetical protein